MLSFWAYNGASEFFLTQVPCGPGVTWVGMSWNACASMMEWLRSYLNVGMPSRGGMEELSGFVLVSSGWGQDDRAPGWGCRDSAQKILHGHSRFSLNSWWNVGDEVVSGFCRWEGEGDWWPRGFKINVKDPVWNKRCFDCVCLCSCLLPRRWVPQNWREGSLMAVGDSSYFPSLKVFAVLVLGWAGRVSGVKSGLFQRLCFRLENWGKKMYLAFCLFLPAHREASPIWLPGGFCNLKLENAEAFSHSHFGTDFATFHILPISSLVCVVPQHPFPFHCEMKCFYAIWGKYFNIHVTAGSLSGLLHGAKWMVLGTLNILLPTHPCVCTKCHRQVQAHTILCLYNPFVSIVYYRHVLKTKTSNDMC